jgi:uncharacterized membrane protein
LDIAAPSHNSHDFGGPQLGSRMPHPVIYRAEDGRYTVFVPSVPTPFAGELYILKARRVHPLDVPLTQALRVIARWGSGAKDLVATMEESFSGQNLVPNGDVPHKFANAIERASLEDAR